MARNIDYVDNSFDHHEDDHNEEDRREKSKVTSKMVAFIVAAILIIGYLSYSLYNHFSRPTNEQNNSNQVSQGEPITDIEERDFRNSDNVNQEGIKIDEDGFIPVSMDGGPLFAEYIDENAKNLDGKGYTNFVCDMAQKLLSKQSRENRGILYLKIKEYAPKADNKSVAQAGSELSGFDFNNPTINQLVFACR